MILSESPKIEAFNIDCMEFMKSKPDKFYDLAIVDPPYGINHSIIAGKQSGSQYGNAATSKKHYITKDWDKQSPMIEYFNDLIRVSKNQIIWGANHFISKIPYDSSYWIVWDKDNGDNNFADCELAYTSFDKAVRKFKWTWNGMLQQNMSKKQERIHPTEKPIELYRWILQKYAKPNDKILDTHGGSFSHAIACHMEGFDLDICELDKDYFNDAVQRFKNYAAQKTLF